MKVGIMQPYFFPYIGYFQLIHHVDHWVVFDDVQYIRRGWINRNRILHPQESWQYINVPLEKNCYKEVINNIRISSTENWKSKIIGQLYYYKKYAPFYNVSMNLVEKSLDIETNSITTLNVHMLKEICSYLEISFSYQISSQENIDYSNVNSAEERILTICKHLQASEYINPIGGRELYDKQKFQQEGIKLSFLKSKMNQLVYQQGSRPFEPALSIIDVLMFCSKNEIRTMLDKFEIL
ncbi:TPA: WbqC family protein [Bacillus pseudomycoides]|nr:WbqC family protein [Bacillus pseudomycoides]